MLSISNRTFRAFSSQLLARLYIICCNLNHHHHCHHCQPHLLCSAALSHCYPCPQSHSCSHDTSSTQSPKAVSKCLPSGPRAPLSLPSTTMRSWMLPHSMLSQPLASWEERWGKLSQSKFLTVSRWTAWSQEPVVQLLPRRSQPYLGFPRWETKI